jgi:hypothetical protein
MYLSDVTSETRSKKIEFSFSAEKEIFFNLFSNIEIVRTTSKVKVTEVTHPTKMSTKNNLLL